MVDFSKLKNRSSKESIEDLKKKAAEQSGNNKYADSNDNNDPRFWQPTVDSMGNGYAVIRFLSETADEDVKFVTTWEHGFKGPTGKWYIEKSRTTIKDKDPVTEYTNKLWATKDKANEELAKKYKRRLYYISNIYVITDPGKPENNGKVFLFKYGKKIMDKINECMMPEFDGNGRSQSNPAYDVSEIQFDPFSMWDGANFKLKIRKSDEQRNYDKSEFDSRSPLGKNDTEREAIWKKQYPLSEFVTDGPRFKSYEALKARFAEVLNADEDNEEEVQKPRPRTSSFSPYDRFQSTRPMDDDIPFNKGDDPSKNGEIDTDIDLDFFKNMAK